MGKSVKPKFYSNWKDDLHCLQAAVMTVLNTLCGKTSWQKVNQSTQFKKGLYSWSCTGAVAIAKHIPGTKLISVLDYTAFAKRGEQYLREFMKPKWFKDQKAHATPAFKREQKSAQRLVGMGLFEKRKILKKDIVKLLAGNLLIALIDVKGVGHFVVVYGQDDKNFFFHDSGSPPRPAFKIRKDAFMKAFGEEAIVVPK